ncbi:hypothetical protein E2542_SST15156 [Spatholobus suberectus]|nr:hypothetical protein E2542_SST15156 [Spatholobus suberectus]
MSEVGGMVARDWQGQQSHNGQGKVKVCTACLDGTIGMNGDTVIVVIETAFCEASHVLMEPPLQAEVVLHRENRRREEAPSPPLRLHLAASINGASRGGGANVVPVARMPMTAWKNGMEHLRYGRMGFGRMGFEKNEKERIGRMD